MVFGPTLGSYIMEMYGINYVVLLASFIALLNVFFIIIAVPESLPYKLRMSNCISWEHADPFVVSFFQLVKEFFFKLIRKLLHDFITVF